MPGCREWRQGRKLLSESLPQSTGRKQDRWFIDSTGNAVTDLGKVLIAGGLILLAAGVVISLLGRTGVPLGRLPGDFLYRGKHTTIYFPLATSVLLSVLLSIVLYVIGRWRR